MTQRVALEATSLVGHRSGVGTMTAALVERLARIDDIDLTALSVTWRGRGAVAQLVPANVAARATSTPARLAHWLWQYVDWPAIGGFDLIHGPNFVAPPARGRNTAELVTVHDMGPWRFPHLVDRHSRGYPRLLERAVRRGTHVHTVSRFVADEVIEATGISPERVHVIPNGFDLPETGPASVQSPAGVGADRGHPGPSQDAPYVLALGTIEPRKDHPTLVEAMALVWEAHPDVRLVVAGSGGWGAEAFDAACARVGAGSRVEVLGYVTTQQRERLLRHAQCLAFPSIYEGFGLPPLEAMARSTPVVASTAGALPETCGDAALLVPPGDSAALADAICTVLADTVTANALIANGLQRVRDFSWDTMAAEMAALYRRLSDYR